MGKTVSAADMLSAGRRRSIREPESADRERLDAQSPSGSVAQADTRLDAQATERLDGQASSSAGAQTPRRLDGQTTKHLDAGTTERLGDQASGRLDVQTSSGTDAQTAERLDVSAGRTADVTTTRRLDAPPTFQRSTVFFTPEQRQWIKRTTKDLPDGLSMSDVVRLAVGRLIADVTEGLDLVPALAAQAHADAQIFVGRRNRGLPPETGEQTA